MPIAHLQLAMRLAYYNNQGRRNNSGWDILIILKCPDLWTLGHLLIDCPDRDILSTKILGAHARAFRDRCP